MDESEVMQLNGKSISEEREGRSRKRVLIVATGFDVRVPAWGTPRKHVLRLESMLRDLFSSCGKIKSVGIPHTYYSSTIKRHAYIEILGEGAKEKALKLSGIEMDGRKLVVTAPLLPLTRTQIKALKSAKRDRSSRSKIMIVRGYDTSLPKKIIKRALRKHFSSCGEVVEVDLFPNQRRLKDSFFLFGDRFALVSIYGEGAKEKALQLSGSDMGGFKLVVEKAIGVKPRQDRGRPLPEDYIGTPSFPELVALMNKAMENPNHNEKKKKRKTSK